MKNKVTTAMLLAAGSLLRQIGIFLGTIIFINRSCELEFGVFTFWYALLPILIGTTDWGVRFFGWTDVARADNKDETIGNILFFKAALSLLAAVIVFVCCFFSGQYAVGLPTAILISLLLIFNQLTLKWIFLGLENFTVVILIEVITGLVFVTIAFFGPQQPSVAYMVGTWLISLVVPCGLGVVVLRKQGVKPLLLTSSGFSRLFRRGRSFVGISITNRLYQHYPIIIIALVSSPIFVSHFRVAHLFYSLMCGLSINIVMVLYSKFATTGIESNTLIRGLGRLMVFSVLLFSPVIIAVENLPPQLVTQLFGAEYVDSLPIIRGMAWVLPIGFVGSMMRELSPSIELSGRLIWCALASVVVGGIFCVFIMVQDMSMALIPIGLGVGELINIVLIVIQIKATR